MKVVITSTRKYKKERPWPWVWFFVVLGCTKPTVATPANDGTSCFHTQGACAVAPRRWLFLFQLIHKILQGLTNIQLWNGFWEHIYNIYIWKKLLHFEWSPPWHHIDTYLSQILTFFVLKSGEDEKGRIILMKLPLDFIRIILSSSSLLLVRDPAVTTVIYLAKLIQTDSRYAWFKRISDARASRDA